MFRCLRRAVRRQAIKKNSSVGSGTPFTTSVLHRISIICKVTLIFFLERHDQIEKQTAGFFGGRVELSRPKQLVRRRYIP